MYRFGIGVADFLQEACPGNYGSSNEGLSAATMVDTRNKDAEMK